MKRIKLSPNQLTLLRAAAQYAIMDDWQNKEFYQLGGHGYVPIRYNRNTLQVLVDHGLVTWGSAQRATEAGIRYLEDMDRKNDPAVQAAAILSRAALNDAANEARALGNDCAD